jgi:hypothetical protein
MGEVRKITPPTIRKLSGGKDPVRLVEEFLHRRGFNSEDCVEERTKDRIQWSVPLSDAEDLEITLEGIGRPPETTIYLGLNILSVPMKDAHRYLTTALIVADKLIGAKLSLVDYDIVLSVTAYAASIDMDELDYFYELILRQKQAVLDDITEELENL